MKNISDLPRLPLGQYPTPFYKLESVSARYGRDVYIKRDDLCGVALGGNKVRKLEFLLARAKADGCDTVFTTGGSQSNHAALTAACAARVGMKAVLLLKQRGVTERRGNLILDELYGAEVHLMDTDSYDDIYAEMRRRSGELEGQGRRCCLIPLGGSTPLGAVGYVNCVREFTVQAMAAGVRVGHIVSATGSGGTTAGLLLGARLFQPGAKVTGVAVSDDPFDRIVPELAAGTAELLDCAAAGNPGDFEMVENVGAFPTHRIRPGFWRWPGTRAFCWTRFIRERHIPSCAGCWRRVPSPAAARWSSSTPAARRRCLRWILGKLRE